MKLPGLLNCTGAPEAVCVAVCPLTKLLSEYVYVEAVLPYVKEVADAVIPVVVARFEIATEPT